MLLLLLLNKNKNKILEFFRRNLFFYKMYKNNDILMTLFKFIQINWFLTMTRSTRTKK